MMEIKVGRVGEMPGHYIGRNGKGSQSNLGNPFKPRERSIEAHKEVCEQYRVWLWQKICAKDAGVLGELEQIRQEAKQAGGVTLQCFCSPLPCHGDVIKKAVVWLDSR